MNALFEQVIKERNGHYCHVIEVEDKYEMECIAEAIIEQHEHEYSEETIIDFLETLEVYCLNDDNEDEVFNFSFTDYIKDTIN